MAGLPGPLSRGAARRRAPLAELRGLAQGGPVTLLFAARDEARNSAVVLKAVLEEEPG